MERPRSDLGIFDSDLLYENEHVELLLEFINQHAAAHCGIIIVDPGRGHHAKFSKKMVALGYSHNQRKAETTMESSAKFSSQVLTYSS